MRDYRNSRITFHVSRFTPRAVQLIPYSVHGLDNLRVRGVALQFEAQPAHVNVYRARAAYEIVAPYAVQEHFAGEYVHGVSGQESEQIEFFWLHLYGLTVAGDGARRRVYGDVTGDQKAGCIGRCG